MADEIIPQTETLRRYRWIDDKPYIVDDVDGGRIAAPLPTLEECPACLPDYADELHRRGARQAACREILRLATERLKLRAEVARLKRLLEAVASEGVMTSGARHLRGRSTPHNLEPR